MTKTIVLSGATSGIGELAAIALAVSDHRLVLLARDEAKAAKTMGKIVQHAPRAQVDFVMCDFTRLRTVATAAQQIADSYTRIDVLINNAGIHAFEQRVTGDGLPEMIAVNYLAPWLLTAICLPNLCAANQGRVVTVASEASRHATPFDLATALTDTTPFNRRESMGLYGQSKLLNIMFSQELARRSVANGLSVNCFDPGFNVTGLGREVPGAPVLRAILKMLNVGNPNRGAQAIVRAAVEPRFGEVTGHYYSRDGKELAPQPPADDSQANKALWLGTAQLLKRLHPMVSAV